MLETFKEKFKGLLFNTIIHVNVKLKESAVLGKPVAFYDKYSRGSKDYYTLAKELLLMGKTQDEPEVVSATEAELKEVAQIEEDVQVISETETVTPSLEQPFSDRMQETVAKEAQEFFTTQFMIEAPGAKSVYVTGSFNDWSLDDGCRLKEANGQWEVSIPLKPGSYKYQFIVDGVWKEDPGNPRRERNSFGDINSLIDVTPEMVLDK
jgi:hypothetical protein